MTFKDSREEERRGQERREKERRGDNSKWGHKLEERKYVPQRC